MISGLWFEAVDAQACMCAVGKISSHDVEQNILSIPIMVFVDAEEVVDVVAPDVDGCVL
jgi:hypothetical protein